MNEETTSLTNSKMKMQFIMNKITPHLYWNTK